MSAPRTIVRVAAKGDGVSDDGKHHPLTAPGDHVLTDGTIERGPHHVSPPCRHFGKCGGCQLQHLDEDTLAQFVSDRVTNAAAGQGLEPDVLAPAHLSPPGARRRATLHATRAGAKVLLGYRQRASHQLVDLSECPVLDPRLIALAGPLRTLLGKQGRKLAADIELAMADQGVDCAIKGLTVDGLEATEAMLDFARDQSLARLTLDQGYGPEALWEPDPVTVTLSGIAVPLPPGAFLQATVDSEMTLTAAVRDWLGDAPSVADLFSGLGTFAFALAGPNTKVLAAEAARDAHMACKGAAGRTQVPVHALHRDLFRNPLQPEELDRFAAVVLDPPRAGAREQVRALAASTVPRIAYISCNPASWARDAATLAEGGYRLAELRPVGQFRWSTHVELASLFVRDA